MKRRQGLVSNSSSSSFVMFGFLVDRKKIDKRHLIEMFTDTDIEKEAKEYAGKYWSEKKKEEIIQEFIMDFISNERVKINGRRVSILGHENEFGKNKIMIGYQPINIDEYEVETFPLEYDKEFFEKLADGLNLEGEERTVLCGAGSVYC